MNSVDPSGKLVFMELLLSLLFMCFAKAPWTQNSLQYRDSNPGSDHPALLPFSTTSAMPGFVLFFMSRFPLASRLLLLLHMLWCLLCR